MTKKDLLSVIRLLSDILEKGRAVEGILDTAEGDYYSKRVARTAATIVEEVDEALGLIKLTYLVQSSTIPKPRLSQSKMPTRRSMDAVVPEKARLSVRPRKSVKPPK